MGCMLWHKTARGESEANCGWLSHVGNLDDLLEMRSGFLCGKRWLYVCSMLMECAKFCGVLYLEK